MPQKGAVPYKSLAPQGWGRLPSLPSDLQPLDTCKAACQLPTVGSVWELRKANAPKARKRGVKHSEAAQPTFFMAVATRPEDGCVKVLALQAKSRGRIELDLKDLNRSRMKLRSKWVHCSHLKRVDATRITTAKFRMRMHVEHESEEDPNLEWLESEHDPDEDWDEAPPYMNKTSMKMRSTERSSTRLASCLHAHRAQSGAAGALVTSRHAGLSEKVWGSEPVQAYRKRHEERDMTAAAENVLLMSTIALWDEGKVGMSAAQHEGEKKRLVQVSKLKALLEKASLNSDASAASAACTRAVPAQSTTYADVLCAPAQHRTIAHRTLKWTNVESTSQNYVSSGFSYNADNVHVTQPFKHPVMTAPAQSTIVCSGSGSKVSSRAASECPAAKHDTNTSSKTPAKFSTTLQYASPAKQYCLPAKQSATYSTTTTPHDSRMRNVSTNLPTTSSSTHQPLVKAACSPQVTSSKVGKCGNSLHTSKQDQYTGRDNTRAQTSKQTQSDSSPKKASFDPVLLAGDVCLFADEILEPEPKCIEDIDPGLMVLCEVASRSPQAEARFQKYDEGLEREYRMMIERLPIEKASVEPVKDASCASVGSPPAKQLDGTIQHVGSMPRVPKCAGMVYTFGDYSVSCKVVQATADWPSPVATNRVQSGIRSNDGKEHPASAMAVFCESPEKGENVLFDAMNLQSPHNASWSSSPGSASGSSFNLGSGFLREGEIESWSWYYGNLKPLVGAEAEPLDGGEAQPPVGMEAETLIGADEVMKIAFETRPTPIKKKNKVLDFEQDHAGASACNIYTTTEGVQASAFKTQSLSPSSPPPQKMSHGAAAAAAQSCMRDPRLHNISHITAPTTLVCGNKNLSHSNDCSGSSRFNERQSQLGSSPHYSSSSPAATSAGTSKHSVNDPLPPPKTLSHTNMRTLGPHDGINDYRPLPPPKALSHTNIRHPSPNDGINDLQLATKTKLYNQSFGSSPRKMSRPAHSVAGEARQAQVGAVQAAMCGPNQQPSSDLYLKHLKKIGMFKKPSSKNKCWSHQKRWVGHQKLVNNKLEHVSFEGSQSKPSQEQQHKQQQQQQHRQQLQKQQQEQRLQSTAHNQHQHANASSSAPPTTPIRKGETIFKKQEASTPQFSPSTHQDKTSRKVSFSQEEKESPDDAVRHSGKRTVHPETPPQAPKCQALHSRKRVLLLGQCAISDYVARQEVDEASDKNSPDYAGDSFEAREEMRRHKAPGGHGVCHCADCEEKIEEYLADSDVDVQEWSSSGQRSALQAPRQELNTRA